MEASDSREFRSFIFKIVSDFNGPASLRNNKSFPDKPDYLVNKDYYNCEGYDKWATEDSEYMFYDTQDEK